MSKMTIYPLDLSLGEPTTRLQVDDVVTYLFSTNPGSLMIQRNEDILSFDQDGNSTLTLNLHDGPVNRDAAQEIMRLLLLCSGWTADPLTESNTRQLRWLLTSRAGAPQKLIRITWMDWYMEGGVKTLPYIYHALGFRFAEAIATLARQPLSYEADVTTITIIFSDPSSP